MRNKISPHYTAPLVSRLATSGLSSSGRVLSRMPTSGQCGSAPVLSRMPTAGGLGSGVSDGGRGSQSVALVAYVYHKSSPKKMPPSRALSRQDDLYVSHI